MSKSYRFQRRIQWLALWAVVIHAFMPFAAGLLAASAHEGYVEVCTARGVRLVRVADAPGQQPVQEHSADGATCPLCSFHACAPVLPSRAVAIALPAFTPPGEGQHYQVVLRPFLPHLIARPRDPPIGA